MRYVRLNVIAEGHAEENFAKDTLAKHLINYGVVLQVRRVMTSKDRKKTYRGGLMKYIRAKMDIESWIKEEKGTDAVFFTTMFDYYALPNDFPGMDTAHSKSSPYDAVAEIENRLLEDIGNHRFIPYIQLHEFEALLLARPSNFLVEFFGIENAVKALENIVANFDGNPELVNAGRETAPSKRIIGVIPEYKGSKVLVGAVLAGFDGIPFLKSHCRHFGEWVNKLEKLGE
jgi:hypothetical protein